MIANINRNKLLAFKLIDRKLYMGWKYFVLKKQEVEGNLYEFTIIAKNFKINRESSFKYTELFEDDAIKHFKFDIELLNNILGLL